MHNNIKTYEMIRSDVKGILKTFEKIIENQDMEADKINATIDEKLMRIKEKLETKDPKTFIKKEENKKQKEKHKLSYADYSIESDFRNFNRYVPRIKINENYQMKTIFSDKDENEEDQEMNHQFQVSEEDRIFESVFDEINPYLNDNNNSNSNNNNIISLPLQQKFKRIDKFQKHKLDPMFFSNRYIEFKYTDASEKNLARNKMKDLLYNMFQKKIDQSITSSLYIANSQTPVFKKYMELMKWEEIVHEIETKHRNSKEEENIDDIIPDDREVKIIQKEQSLLTPAIKTSALVFNAGQTTNQTLSTAVGVNLSEAGDIKTENKSQNLLTNYNKFVTKISNEKLRKNKNIQKYSSSSSMVPELTGVSSSKSQIKVINFHSGQDADERNEKIGHIDDRYEPTSISFGIAIQGVIKKRIRNTDKYHDRAVLVEGPLATWFRYKEISNENTNIVKGVFDIRKIPNDDPLKSAKDPNAMALQKMIVVPQYYEGKVPKLVNKQINFRSDSFKEFSGKSFKEVFEQIKKYYSCISVSMKSTPIDYKRLKYLSDAKCESFSLPDYAKILENMEWHLKLKKVSLRLSDITAVQSLFEKLEKNNIRLESLTLEYVTSKNNQLEFPTELNVKSFFMSNACVSLRDFHLINFKFEKGIKQLLECLEGKYSVVKNYSTKNESIVDMGNFNSISNSSGCEQVQIQFAAQSQPFLIPYKNLTFKRTDPNVSIKVDLNDLYTFFQRMANEFGGIDKFSDAFNKLDISGTDTTNLDGLKNIINVFKIIKELDISNTKYEKSANIITTNPKEKTSAKDKANFTKLEDFLINNIDFLRSIVVVNPLVGPKKSIGFDYSFGLLPILKSIYVVDTPITVDAFTELLNLFKKLKFFQSFVISEHSYQNIQENLKSYLGSFIGKMYSDDKLYCENIFEVELSDKAF